MKIEIEIPDDKVDLLRKLCEIEMSAPHTLSTVTYPLTPHDNPSINNECLHWFYEGVQVALDKELDAAAESILKSIIGR